MFREIFALYGKLQRRTAEQFLRFAVVGATNTVLDFGVYLALTRGTDWWSGHLVLSAVASFCVAATSSFLLNNFWTFRQSGVDWQRRLPKFFTVAIGGLALNALLLQLLLLAGLHDVLAKLLATGAVMLWNFALQKRYTFKV